MRSSGTKTSPLGWNRVANTAVRQRKLDLWSAARALALVNFAMADGFIAGSKPSIGSGSGAQTAIRAAGQSEHWAADADTNWRPFLITPPVPDYPSTHTVLGWAAGNRLPAGRADRWSRPFLEALGRYRLRGTIRIRERAM